MSYPNARRALAVALSGLLAAPLLQAADTPAAAAGAGSADSDATAGTEDVVLPTVVVTAQLLNEKRAGIETQTGASTYTIDDAAIAATPGADNTLLNQVVLQAPDVVQDSFGQFHVRGDHNDVQYRLNGIILPEGISVFGQSLSPRLISSLQLITGALPAEYGLRTAGIIDMTTKSGVLQPGGSISLYGGSHETVEPSFDYGGSSGDLNYFVSGDFLRNDLGIESPDGSSNPVHDHTSQYHGFGYFEDILNSSNRLSLILGTSNDKFQIPDQSGLQPGLMLSVNGQSAYPSVDLNENQRESTSYAIVSWQHAQDALDWQSSVTSRYSTLSFTPDAVGDLLYDGIAQWASKRDVALGWQTDASYKLNDAHTARAGLYLQYDDATSSTNSLVLPTSGGVQTGEVPETIPDNGSQAQWIESLYLQDEWTIVAPLTLNYGLRLDHYNAYSSGTQLSPRLNAVWQPIPGTTLHAGYSRYFTPPDFELVSGTTVSRFIGTTNQSQVSADSPVQPERSDYFDIGVTQRITPALTIGLDAYYKIAKNLLDEGQFGTALINTPFNYQYGRVYGLEFTTNYKQGNVSAYLNLAYSKAQGKDVDSAQFNFTAAELAYIANNWVFLDHDQRVTVSLGGAYELGRTTFTADAIVGSGLRSGFANTDKLPWYGQLNLAVIQHFNEPVVGKFDVRLVVINAINSVYELRDGSGIGVEAPQFGPQRAIYAGITKLF